MRGPTTWRIIALVPLLLLTAPACGDDSGTTTVPAREAGAEPITARALAAVVEERLADQVGEATSARPELDGPRAVGGVGAALRFAAEDEPSRPAVSVSVGPKASAAEFTCVRLRQDFYDGCVATGGGVLFWQKETPEEDPGVVYVVLRKGASTVLLFQSGPLVTGDPRRLDLRISVKDMFAIARDPRVDVTTSAETIRAGEDLERWTDQP